MELILYFFLYSFFGWLCECIYCSIPAHTFINRGFLAGPYCPIYGCGALAVLHILDPFGYSIPLMFVMGIIVTSALEYVTSWGMEVLFHTKWWDYSSYPFNIHGRVCLKNSLLFGCMVLVVYYLIHPAIQEFVHLFSPGMQTMLCTAALFGFGYDLLHSTCTAAQEQGFSGNRGKHSRAAAGICECQHYFASGESKRCGSTGSGFHQCG